MPQQTSVWRYGLAYLLWIVTIAVTILCGLVMLNTLSAVSASIDLYWGTFRAIRQFTVFGLGLAALVLIVVGEWAFRTGAERQCLWARFSLFMAWALGVIGVLQLVPAAIIASAGIVDWLQITIIIVELGAAAAFWWWRRRLLH